MKEELTDILSKIDLEIDEIDLYGYDIIETSLVMIHRLQAIINELRQDWSDPKSFVSNFWSHFISPIYMLIPTKFLLSR